MEPQPRTKLSAEYRAWVASRLATNFISTPPPSYPIVGRPPPSRPQLQLVPRGSALRHAQPHGRRLGIQKRSNHHRQQRQVGCRSTPSSSSTPAFDLSASVQASTTAPAASAYLAAKKSSRSSIGIPPLRDDGEWPTCVVCLEPVSSHDWTSTNKCKHVFCTPCIRQVKGKAQRGAEEESQHSSINQCMFCGLSNSGFQQITYVHCARSRSTTFAPPQLQT